MKKITLLNLFILILISSCGGSKKTVVPKEEKTTKKIEKEVFNEKNKSDLDFDILRYIARYKNIAKKDMKEYGIPASIKLAQGILESQYGKSRLATQANNHFGIKCNNDWKGETIRHDDDEQQECFRKYSNPEESFKDHSQFLANRKRYAFLFRLKKTDYEAWARGLKKAGYATDPSYPDKLIYIIEKYNLSNLDKEVLQEMSVKLNDIVLSDDTNKKKKFIYEVKHGETLFTISRKFNIPVKDIQRINNLNDFDIYEGQILVLTENKTQENDYNEKEVEQTNQIESFEDKSDNLSLSKPVVSDDKFNLYTVKQGETLFSISKKLQISMEELRKANNLTDNEIKVGLVLKIPVDKIQNPKEEAQKEIPKKLEEKAVYHIVKPGETLYRIHINYDVPISQLKKLNNLKGNNIKVGQKLRVK